jgi:hypothetical protein
MKIEGEVHAELARHAENARQIQVSSLWSAAGMHFLSHCVIARLTRPQLL